MSVAELLFDLVLLFGGLIALAGSAVLFWFDSPPWLAAVCWGYGVGALLGWHQGKRFGRASKDD
jgi:hypothetical protein